MIKNTSLLFIILNLFFSQVIFSQTIPDPTVLEYTYEGVEKDEAGTKHMMYIEKNHPPNSEGDYGWGKIVPFYSSNDITKSYEYQLDFSDKDFDLVKKWLIKTFGYKINAISWDNPSWYNDDMSLTESYKYCKKYNSDITIAYRSERYKDRMIVVVIESGSRNSQGGLAILYFFLNR